MIFERRVIALLFFLSVTGFAESSFGFEHTKVLPTGVRGLNIRSVDTNIESKTDSAGNPLPLASPLQKDLTFSRIIAGEDAVRGKQLRAFLQANGFDESEAVGNFTADLKGHVQVIAPIASFGLTDRLTLAVAMPYYRAATSLEVGFKQNDRAAAFVAALASPDHNQIEGARDASAKLNNAVGQLNAKLTANGYSELEDWSASGFGDMTIAAKYLAFDRGVVSGAFTAGIVAPTGKTDDPDILTDIPFGDGQWDVFGQVAFDQPLSKYVFFNQFAKYTWQLPASKKMRDVTADENIEVERISTRFKLGDKVDAGFSLNYQSPGGVVLGVGHMWFQKYGDVYYGPQNQLRPQLADASNQYAEVGEIAVGYSTIPAFQRGQFVAPLELKLGYQRQFRSENMPVSDLAQIDASMFF